MKIRVQLICTQTYDPHVMYEESAELHYSQEFTNTAYKWTFSGMTIIDEKYPLYCKVCDCNAEGKSPFIVKAELVE